METKRKAVCSGVVAALCLLLLVLPGAAADGTEPTVLSCTQVPMYIDGEYIGSGILMDAVTYVPLRTFTEHILQEPCEATWDQDAGTATLRTDRLTVSITLGQGYMSANGRMIYLGDAAYNVNGTILVPIRELARMLGLALTWDTDRWAIHIDDSAWSVPVSGDSYYGGEELYWLSRVICSEAANQPLEGMIGVGNVVLNRLNDPTGQFGGSVSEVIFQYGQFDVVASGMIYCEPSDAATVAAKLCLEGYNTVGQSKWFVNPRIGISTWMRLNKTYYCTIADHDFYA